MGRRRRKSSEVVVAERLWCMDVGYIMMIKGRTKGSLIGYYRMSNIDTIEDSNDCQSATIAHRQRGWLFSSDHQDPRT